jgi:hypothetical protein
MAVKIPNRFGIVLRKSGRTAESIARLSRWRARVEFMSQDDHLVAFTVASNLRDLQEESRALRSEGCVPGEDYVLTSSEDGVLGTVPSWLLLAPPHGHGTSDAPGRDGDHAGVLLAVANA